MVDGCSRWESGDVGRARQVVDAGEKVGGGTGVRGVFMQKEDRLRVKWD